MFLIESRNLHQEIKNQRTNMIVITPKLQKELDSRKMT